MSETGRISEIFSSIQGEGVYVGRRHLFLRLAGCGFGCSYCDQPEAREAPPKARIEVESATRRLRQVRNPLTAEAVAEAVVALDSPPGLHHAICVTGGEPLEQAPFLAEILPLIKQSGACILLETNGVHFKALAGLLQWVGITSMDFKGFSTTGKPTPLETHERFLEIAAEHDVYVKMVIGPETPEEEVTQAAKIISNVRSGIPLVLQPQHGAEVEAQKLLALQKIATERVPDVRVIPQVHRFLNLP